MENRIPGCSHICEHPAFRKSTGTACSSPRHRKRRDHIHQRRPSPGEIAFVPQPRQVARHRDGTLAHHRIDAESPSSASRGSMRPPCGRSQTRLDRSCLSPTMRTASDRPSCAPPELPSGGGNQFTSISARRPSAARARSSVGTLVGCFGSSMRRASFSFTCMRRANSDLEIPESRNAM